MLSLPQSCLLRARRHRSLDLVALGGPDLAVAALTQAPVPLCPFLAGKREQCCLHLEREAGTREAIWEMGGPGSDGPNATRGLEGTVPFLAPFSKGVGSCQLLPARRGSSILFSPQVCTRTVGKSILRSHVSRGHLGQWWLRVQALVTTIAWRSTL